MTGLDAASVRQAATDCAFIGGREAVVEFHPCLSSTNDRLAELAAQGAVEGSVVVAAQQDQGRGRLGRAWASPAGGIYLSLLLRPDAAMLRRLPATLLGALAVAEAISLCCDREAVLKWPNDVQLEGRKVAGILGELTRDEAGHLLILGIGVNLAIPEDSFPEELRATACSIVSDPSQAPPPAEFLRALFARFEEHYLAVRRGGGVSILSAASARMPMLGKEVRIRLPERTVVGVANGLNQTGGLVLEVDGRREVFVAGEVEEVRPQ